MMPSLLGLMGFAADIPAGVQGTNFEQLIRTGDGARPSSQLYLRIPQAKDEAALRGVRTGRHTLVLERGGGGSGRTILYDNSKDPYQLRDIASESPAIVRRLVEEELKPWLTRTSDSFLG
jgi:hypothetical protein